MQLRKKKQSKQQAPTNSQAAKLTDKHSVIHPSFKTSTDFLINWYSFIMTTPCIANDSVGIIDPFIFALLLVPLSYMGICLIGFTIGSIGSRRGFLRIFLSSLFCCLLVFCLLIPAELSLPFIEKDPELAVLYEGLDVSSGYECTLWVDICKML